MSRIARDEPVVRLRYRLRHLGDAPFPWIWSAHPLLNVQPGTVLELPTRASGAGWTPCMGATDLARNDIVSWPAGLGGEADRFRFPGERRLGGQAASATSGRPGG